MPTIPPGASVAEIAQMVLDSNEAVLNAHGVTVTYRLGVGWMDVEPEVNTPFFLAHFADPVLFTNDFSGSSGKALIPPSAAYTAPIKYVAPGSLIETTVGSSTIATTGAISFLTSGGDLAVPAGGTLLFYSGAAKLGAKRVSMIYRGGYVL